MLSRHFGSTRIGWVIWRWWFDAAVGFAIRAKYSVWNLRDSIDFPSNFVCSTNETKITASIASNRRLRHSVSLNFSMKTHFLAAKRRLQMTDFSSSHNRTGVGEQNVDMYYAINSDALNWPESNNVWVWAVSWVFAYFWFALHASKKDCAWARKKATAYVTVVHKIISKVWRKWTKTEEKQVSGAIRMFNLYVI